MSGTSETELKALMHSMGLTSGFLGTFDRRFPGFINREKLQTAIINTGTREGGGMHWLAMAWNPFHSKLFLFDPLGWNERDLMKLYGFSYGNMVKRSALSTVDKCVQLVKNSQAVQCTCAGSCGLFAVLFLYCFLKNPNHPDKCRPLQAMYGMSPSVVPSNPVALHENQKKLYEFFMLKSPYFVRNKRTLVSNTRLGLINSHM